MPRRMQSAGIALLAATAAGYATMMPSNGLRGPRARCPHCPPPAWHGPTCPLRAHHAEPCPPSRNPTPTRAVRVASAAPVRPQAAWVQQQLQGELEQQQQQQQQRRAVLRAPAPDMVATGPGLFTQSNPEDRRVVPDELGDRVIQHGVRLTAIAP